MDRRIALRDLRFRRLLDEAAPATLEPTRSPPTIEDFIAAAAGSDDRSVAASLRRRGPRMVKSVERAISEIMPASAIPLPNFVELFGRPHRELVHADSKCVDLLHCYITDDGVVVAHARCDIDRGLNLAVTDATLVTLDDFEIARDRPRLLDLLADLAQATDYRIPHPRVRAGLVLAPSADSWLEQVDRIVAVAAIHDVHLDVHLAPPDPNDTKARDAFINRVGSGRYAVMLTASLPSSHERWIHRLGQTFNDRPGRQFHPLRSDLAELEATIAWMLPAIAHSYPEQPTITWGDEAITRIGLRQGPAFQLTPQAVAHLHRNPYPDVERLLAHVEKLSELAEEWSRLRGEVGGRVEDWAYTKFELRIALHDRRIRDNRLVYDEVALDNTPHVKVDDHTAASECGRIYFALDGAPRWRIIVDHIGLHTRS